MRKLEATWNVASRTRYSSVSINIDQHNVIESPAMCSPPSRLSTQGSFICAFSFQLGASKHRYRRGKRRMVFTDTGRSLGITATLRSGEKIRLLNVYKYTAAHTNLQSKLWERLKGWIRKHLAERSCFWKISAARCQRRWSRGRLSGRILADNALEDVRNILTKA